MCCLLGDRCVPYDLAPRCLHPTTPWTSSVVPLDTSVVTVAPTTMIFTSDISISSHTLSCWHPLGVGHCAGSMSGKSEVLSCCHPCHRVWHLICHPHNNLLQEAYVRCGQSLQCFSVVLCVHVASSRRAEALLPGCLHLWPTRKLLYGRRYHEITPADNHCALKELSKGLNPR
jgi:hypothetical protein